MGLTRTALRRPVTVIMFFCALAAMGLLAFSRLPIQRFPNISFPSVSITVVYPGASPQDVEALVTKPLENAVIGVNGIDSIESTSVQGRSRLQINFIEGVDVNAAAIDIGRKVNEVRGKLPAAAQAPSISKADVNAAPIMNIAFSSETLDLVTLTTVITEQIQPTIQSINGVADVSITGGATRQIQVRVDPAKLRAYGLSLQQVQNALANQNVGLPGGTIRTDSLVFNTRTLALAQQADQLGSVIINAPAGTAPNTPIPGGTGLRLRDVAEVLDTNAFQATFQRLNGRQAVGLSISQQSGANGVKISDDVRSTLDKLQASMGKQSGIDVEIVNDQSIFTRAAVDDVQHSLMLAIILTACVLLFFLRTLRNTFMVLIAIPCSIISTFFIMYLVGFSLNTMSLMALALLIGILVDDSIVLLENINRHLSNGEPPWTAALEGRWEIGLAAIAITMTDVVVYLPVAFMQGNIGQLFREFGLTIVIATLFSMTVGFTLTPMLASRLLQEGSLESEGKRGIWAAITRAWDRGFYAMRDRYTILLGHALNRRWLPVMIGFGMLALVASFIPLRIVGTEYAPGEDNSLFIVQLTTPVGTSVQSTGQVMEIIEGRLLALPEVKTVFASVGSSGGSSALSVQEQNGAITVGLVDKGERHRSIFDIVRQVRTFGADFPGLQLRTQVPSPLVGGGGSPIQLRITGPEQGEINRLTEQVLGIVQRTPGTTEVRSSAILPVPEYQAIVNTAKAAEYGITAQTIANTVSAAVGGVVASQLRQEGHDQIDIVLQMVGAETMTAEDLGAIPVIVTGGLSVRLDQVANIVPGDGAAQLTRYNRARGVQVLANVNGRSMGDVLNDIQKGVGELNLSTGYAITTAGQSSQLDATFAALFGALILSILLMYMLMAALYESFIYPLAVIACLPVALVGAIFGLLLDGDTLNVFSMIGMIMLMGLVAKNAILLVDYTNTLRRRGLSRREALLEAGPTRLRPITMTTVTLFFAMAPLALKMGAGAESRSPMAIVVIAGMLVSTLLTLFLVPCAYTYLDDLQNLLLRRHARALEAPAVGRLTPEVAISGGSDE